MLRTCQAEALLKKKFLKLMVHVMQKVKTKLNFFQSNLYFLVHVPVCAHMCVCACMCVCVCVAASGGPLGSWHL